MGFLFEHAMQPLCPRLPAFREETCSSKCLENRDCAPNKPCSGNPHCSRTTRRNLLWHKHAIAAKDIACPAMKSHAPVAGANALGSGSSSSFLMNLRDPSRIGRPASVQSYRKNIHRLVVKLLSQPVPGQPRLLATLGQVPLRHSSLLQLLPEHGCNCRSQRTISGSV